MKYTVEGRKMLESTRKRGAEGSHEVQHTALVFWTEIEEVNVG